MTAFVGVLVNPWLNSNCGGGGQFGTAASHNHLSGAKLPILPRPTTAVLDASVQVPNKPVRLGVKA
jgi:hypothetical protein